MEEYQVQLTMAINILSWSQRMHVSAWVDVRIALGFVVKLMSRGGFWSFDYQDHGFRGIMIIINLKLFFHLFVLLFISSFETIQVTTTEVEILVMQMYYIRAQCWGSHNRVKQQPKYSSSDIYSSNQRTALRLRWLVGSSNNKRVGCTKRALANDIRILNPPLKWHLELG